MKNNPLISVLIPYYNDEDFLKESIESVLNQTYNNFELILINHVSTDSSRDIAHSFNDERIIHFDMPRNEGASGAFIFPKFMELSKGEYLKPFCSDDVMVPDCLKIFIELLDKNPDTDIVFSDADYINKNGKSLSVSWFTNRKYFDINDTANMMLKKYKESISFLPYISVFIKKSSFYDIELNNNFILFFDMSLWAQSLIKNKKIKLIEEKTVLYRIHKKQISGLKQTKFINGVGYELSAYTNLFYQIDNIETVKEICKNKEFANQLMPGDERFIEFVLAHDFFGSNHYQQKINAYLKISKMFQDEKLRMELYKKFGFGVKEFRELYAKAEKKVKINNKRPKQLNLFELLFLVVRYIFKIVTFSSLRKKLKKNKKYTA